MEVLEWLVIHFVIVIRHLVRIKNIVLVRQLGIHAAQVFTLLGSDLCSLAVSTAPCLECMKANLQQGRK